MDDYCVFFTDHFDLVLMISFEPAAISWLFDPWQIIEHIHLGFHVFPLSPETPLPPLHSPTRATSRRGGSARSVSAVSVSKRSAGAVERSTCPCPLLRRWDFWAFPEGREEISQGFMPATSRIICYTSPQAASFQRPVNSIQKPDGLASRSKLRYLA